MKGVLTRNPEWEPSLAGFLVESSWVVGDWDDVQSTVAATTSESPQVVIAQLLLALRSHEDQAIAHSLSRARITLGRPIASSGPKGYRSAHDAVLDLHLVHELEMIHEAVKGPNVPQKVELTVLSHTLNSRLESTLPTFRNRERVLSMRRTAFEIWSVF